MKKFLPIVLCLILSLTSVLFTSCKKQEESVNLKYYASASDMLPAIKQGEISVGLLPEPACTNLTKTVAKDQTFYRLSLGELYDSENKSYPQAVILVKSSLLNTYGDIAEKLQTAITGNVEWLKDNAESGVNAVNSRLQEGVTPSLNSKVMTAEVINNCSIYFKSASLSVEYCKNYINQIISVEESSAKPLADDFFYNGTASGEFNKETITVVAPDGAPALALAKSIAENQDFGTGKRVNFSVVSSDKIGGAVSKGTGDIVIIPINAASKLYKANAEDTYKMVGVVTHGNLYIMSTEEITLSDLKGKTVGVIGQGLVPDLTLKAILSKNNISYQVG